MLDRKLFRADSADLRIGSDGENGLSGADTIISIGLQERMLAFCTLPLRLEEDCVIIYI